MLIIQICKSFKEEICKSSYPCHIKSTSEAFDSRDVPEYSIHFCSKVGKIVEATTGTFKAKMQEALYKRGVFNGKDNNVQ